MNQPLSKQTILAVDDTPENLDVVRGILTPRYMVKAATDGPTALKIAAAQPPDLILLDIMMPDMDGYEVCRQLKANPNTSKIPVIFLTAKDQVKDEAKGFSLGAADYIQKPVSPPILLVRIKNHLALSDQNHTLEVMVQERTQELRQTRIEIIQRLGRAAEFRDNETGMHVVRVSKSCQLLALAAGLGEDTAEKIYHAAPMHDIGKIGIPDEILLKPGKLDPDEFAIMETHTIIGAQILGGGETKLMELARSVAMTHHERWDGTGYPNHLKGEAIPIAGRIVAVCDVFDALTSVRPYKKAWPVEQATSLLKENAGSHFDPKLVDLFMGILPEVKKIMATYTDEE